MLILFDNGTPAPLWYALKGHVVVEAIERADGTSLETANLSSALGKSDPGLLSKTDPRGSQAERKNIARANSLRAFSGGFPPF